MEQDRSTSRHSISVVICTYNRLPLLAQAIDSVVAQRYRGWELIIVDNNSTDGTREYVLDLAADDPRIRWVPEPRQGAGYARNRGALSAAGDIIAFCDDDQQADPAWLEEISKVFRACPDVGCIGGPTILADKDRVPFHFRKMVGLLGEARSPRPPSEGWYLAGRVGLFGGNIAVRRQAFERAGGFPGDIGRCGEGLLADEDILFSHAVFDAGYQLAYDPKAVCYHALLPSRMTFSYLKRHARGMAFTRARRGKALRYVAEALFKALRLPIFLLWPPAFVYALYRLLVAVYKCEAAVRLRLAAAVPPVRATSPP